MYASIIILSGFVGFLIGTWLADYRYRIFSKRESAKIDRLLDAELYERRYGYSSDKSSYQKECSIELIKNWIDWFKCKK